MIITQHQCGLDGTPSIFHKTGSLREHSTPPPPHPPKKKNQPVSSINISSGRDNEEIVRIASEGQKEKISVTYDLAIAKVAMQIQAEEKPTFDKIFISLGSFHLEMDFFVSWEKLLKNQVVLIFWINVKFWQKGQLIRF